MKKATLLLFLSMVSLVCLSQQKIEELKTASPGTYQFVFTDELSDPVSLNGSVLEWIEGNREETKTVYLQIREGVFVRIPSKEEIKAPDYELMSEYIVDADFKPILIQRK